MSYIHCSYKIDEVSSRDWLMNYADMALVKSTSKQLVRNPQMLKLTFLQNTFGVCDDEVKAEEVENSEKCKDLSSTSHYSNKKNGVIQNQSLALIVWSS
ncbi:hypothetical protein Q3G72_015142 [Acer saccharum]|nr:hypothetical protein Q3G72_015142 [Acer saccharum]